MIPARKADSFRLDNKTAVIIGAASGIGRAIAEIFASGGAAVHVVDIDGEKARAVAQEISACAYACDATDESLVSGIFDAIAARSPIDVLVNSVGVAHVGTLESTGPEDFDRIFRVNVKSYYNAMRAAVAHMKGRGGVILNIASIAASAGLKDRFAYSMSKGAVLAMTYSVAKDYLADKIRCNSISPARVHAVRRRICAAKLSRPRARSVRHAGRFAADWKNGRAGGGRRAGSVSLFG
jgi:2-keto-3-deoxy-L-fuconate dehydrogenase